MTTTNLADLPTDTMNSNSSPIQTNTLQSQSTDNVNVVIPNPSQELKIQRDKDTKNLNEFVTGIQQASSNGALNLPSRDIPQETSPIIQDQNIKPNYIPETNNKGYIEENKSKEDIIQYNNNQQRPIINTDLLFEYYRVPIILAMLYFAFQTPYLQENLNKYVPSLFNTDGNMNVIGSLITSILFATAYLFVDNGIIYLNIS